jgi:sirohydrochlorin ferrochelatase
MCWSSCWWSALVPAAAPDPPDTPRRTERCVSRGRPLAFFEPLVPLRQHPAAHRPLSSLRGVIPLADALPCPADLPSSTDPGRWPFLQRLRRLAHLQLEPWLLAIETDGQRPDADLITALAPHLGPEHRLRLLRWWARQAEPDPQLPQGLGIGRDPALALWLRGQLQGDPVAQAATRPPQLLAGLLTLVGHQRDPQAWPLLRAWLEAPIPSPVRRAALEGLAVGLPVWPRVALRRCLLQLAGDLDPQLAATAVDLLARLPGCRRQLVPLSRRALDAAVAQRLQRRLAATPVQPLLLVVHGRSGGALPAELVSLAEELEQRRGAPVRLQALTASAPPDGGPLLATGLPLTLVPLLLLPGGHVCHDVPAIAAHWRRHTRVQRLPFLGAWPSWQQALRRELLALHGAADPGQGEPLLLHHPLASALAERYLGLLGRATGCRTLATPYSAPDPEDPPLSFAAPALPLVLAANRLTDRLGEEIGVPLLQRPALRAELLDTLEALP